ncbi:MAG: hypothetical protein J2P50_01880 [Hyphomicrobiaceae bacterium]|nr:hypothetical protein [Hyphomicrobiaceae bacterium]
MRTYETLKRRQQLFGMTAVAVQNRPIDAIGYHRPDLATTIGLSKQALPQSGRMDFRNSLVLGEGPNFGLRQTAQPNAVLQRNHGVFLPGNATCSLLAFSG